MPIEENQRDTFLDLEEENISQEELTAYLSESLKK